MCSRKDFKEKYTADFAWEHARIFPRPELENLAW